MTGWQGPGAVRKGPYNWGGSPRHTLWVPDSCSMQTSHLIPTRIHAVLEPTRHHLPSGRYLLSSISSYQSGTLPCYVMWSYPHMFAFCTLQGLCRYVCVCGCGCVRIYIYIYCVHIHIYIYNMYLYTQYGYINVYIQCVYIQYVSIYMCLYIYICNMYIYTVHNYITCLHGLARLKFDADRYHLYSISTLELPSMIQKRQVGSKPGPLSSTSAGNGSCIQCGCFVGQSQSKLFRQTSSFIPQSTHNKYPSGKKTTSPSGPDWVAPQATHPRPSQLLSALELHLDFRARRFPGTRTDWYRVICTVYHIPNIPIICIYIYTYTYIHYMYLSMYIYNIYINIRIYKYISMYMYK